VVRAELPADTRGGWAHFSDIEMYGFRAVRATR
jgi:hypothetical protein